MVMKMKVQLLVLHLMVGLSFQMECTCVKFHECGDKREDFLGLIDERSGNPVIDIRDGQNGKCTGLTICCKNITTTTKTPSSPPPAQCGIRQPDGVGARIKGFEDRQTQLGEFPWMVAVLDRDTVYIGGGSLVRKRVVLTAGHKVYQRTPESLVARIGDWDISKPEEHIDPQNIDVENILYHPKFNRQKHEYNVAILILKTEATYGETVAPVCLPDPGQNFDGKNCFVTGWGKHDFQTGKFQEIMKKVSVPIVEHSQCQTQLRRTRLGSGFDLHSSFTCAGGHAEDACTGDGGSPLVCPGGTNPNELVLVGVVSWGIGCGIVGNPGVYGSVLKSVDWISQTIQDEVGINFDPRISN